MDLDHFKDAIREALRPELEKLAARGDAQAEADALMLTEGAKYRLVQRHMDLPDMDAQKRNGFFALGSRLADKIPL
jgi:hypothetical protein